MKPWTTFASLIVVAMFVGCEMGQNTGPNLNLSASEDRIYVNETTTLFANTKNMLGRDPEVRWTSTFGQLEPDQNGRVARFTSDRPGVALITAEVVTESGQVIRDQKEIRVRGLR